MKNNSEESKEDIFKRLSSLPPKERKQEIAKLSAKQAGTYFSMKMVQGLNNLDNHDKST